MPKPALAKVVAAAPALALSGFPAKGQPFERLAPEERRRHADVARIIPVLPFAGHLSGAVGAQGGEAVLAHAGLHQPRRRTRARARRRRPGTSPTENFPASSPGFAPARSSHTDWRLPDAGVPSMRWMRSIDLILNLDAPPHVLPWRPEIATEQDQVDFHRQCCPLRTPRIDVSSSRGAGRKPTVRAQWPSALGLQVAECDLLGAHRGRYADVVAMQDRCGLGHIDDRRGEPFGFARAAGFGRRGAKLFLFLGDPALHFLCTDERPGFRGT